jgi:uncharacterized protein
VTTRDTAPLGAPCWIDLNTSDLDGAVRFYGELFGWTAEDAGEDYGHYHNVSKDGALVGGLMRRQPDAGGHPDFWMTYLSSADAKATAAAASDAGGQVVLEPMAVMELGAMAVLADPTGGAVGVWQPGRHRGYEVHSQAGAPVWHELHTRDHDGAVAFYQRVFGWQTSVVSDTDEFRYTTMTEGEEQYAGIMDASAYLPEGTSSFWEVYFGVQDADAALAAAERLGGRVLEPAVDTPYGRMAKVADPTGAVFKIVTVST